MNDSEVRQRLQASQSAVPQSPAERHASTVKALCEMWGDRLPTWEEFRQAKEVGRLRTDKSVALHAIHWRGVPKAWMVIYGILTPWAACLVVPITVGMYFIRNVSAWWIFASVFTAWFLFRITQEGACEAIKDAATQDHKMYEALVDSGAFLFGPAPPLSKEQKSNPKVLIADHNHLIAELVGKLLQEAGYEIRIEQSSNKAIQCAGEFRPQLLVIDPVMPGIMGDDTAIQIARQTKCKVLFLTVGASGVPVTEMLRDLQQRDCDCEALAKPFEADELLEHVCRRIGAANRASKCSGTDSQQATEETNKQVILGRLQVNNLIARMATTPCLLLGFLFLFAIGRIIKFGNVHDYLILAVGSCLSGMIIFAYGLLVLGDREKKSWPRALLAFSGPIPYVFGCYLVFYKGFWESKGLFTGFSARSLVARLAFVILGYQVVNGFYRVTEFVEKVAKKEIILE
jgi:CheY-like chemotaxis protein